MTPNDETPKGKLGRGLVYGNTAAQMGVSYLKYAAKKPFTSVNNKESAHDFMTEKNAKILFGGLSRLKGTALKLAQLLSLELDIFPAEIRAQLEKSYTDAPPMNRALARKVLINTYGENPEAVFASFESKAFAAASLGQVHKAMGDDGNQLALKVQYPGIRQTIYDDIRLFKSFARPFADRKILDPAIDEVETRFLEETDYVNEAQNMQFFSENLNLENVIIPQVRQELCTDKVLCMSFMEGQTLNHWLATTPKQEDKDLVAHRLNQIFLKSFYELHCIHADPNPGNYLVGEKCTIGLVDYGCVKKFSPEFVKLYQQLPQIIIQGDKTQYFEMLRQMQVVDKELDREIEEEIFECVFAFGTWLGRLFESEFFDFGLETGYTGEGNKILRDLFKYRKHFSMNPELVFLDRTRYGLLRIFEKLKCRISLRNPYEYIG